MTTEYDLSLMDGDTCCAKITVVNYKECIRQSDEWVEFGKTKYNKDSFWCSAVPLNPRAKIKKIMTF